MNKNSILLLISCLPLLGLAQDRLGMSHSNCSPVTSIFLNPASSVDSKAYLQLGIAASNAYARTNFGYLPDFKMSQL